MLISWLEFWFWLIVEEQKAAYLKVDFDSWQNEDASDSEKPKNYNKLNWMSYMDYTHGI